MFAVVWVRKKLEHSSHFFFLNDCVLVMAIILADDWLQKL